MQTSNVKQEAYHLLENLPENATWDDLMYKIYVRQCPLRLGLKTAKLAEP